MPRFKMGSTSDLRWIITFFCYAVYLAMAGTIHYYCLAEEHPNVTILSYGTIGGRASPDWTVLERWLALGFSLSLPVAFRSFFKKGHWFSISRRPYRF